MPAPGAEVLDRYASLRADVLPLLEVLFADQVVLLAAPGVQDHDLYGWAVAAPFRANCS